MEEAEDLLKRVAALEEASEGVAGGHDLGGGEARSTRAQLPPR